MPSSPYTAALRLASTMLSDSIIDPPQTACSYGAGGVVVVVVAAVAAGVISASFKYVENPRGGVCVRWLPAGTIDDQIPMGLPSGMRCNLSLHARDEGRSVP